MHVLNFSFITRNKIYIIIIMGIIAAFILIFISFSSVLKLPLDNALNFGDIFSSTSYYAEYEITEISNKNKNIYIMNETYKKDNEIEYFKFGYKDFLGNDVMYIVAGDKIKFENSTEINSYILKTNNFRKTNLFSLATYIEIINNNKGCDCFKINMSNEEDNIKKYDIVLNKDRHDKSCIHNELFSEGLKIKKIELLISDNKPIDITVYGLDNNVYINLKYTKFENNAQISDELFKF